MRSKRQVIIRDFADIEMFIGPPPLLVVRDLYSIQQQDLTCEKLRIFSLFYRWSDHPILRFTTTLRDGPWCLTAEIQQREI
jgi:hypothetical protein